MKMSIFPKSKHLPSKEEKAAQSWYTSKPHLPEVVGFENNDQLIDIVTSYTWSPTIFKEYRRQDGFISTDLMVLDIDEDLRINEAEEIVHKLNLIALVLPTTSHSEDYHKFRIIFPLSRTITNVEEFKATMRYLADHFPADPACIADASRFYFGSTMKDGFWYGDGKLLHPNRPEKPKKGQNFSHELKDYVVVGKDLEEVVEYLYGEKRNKVPEQISYFLENAPDNLSGEWYCRSNSFLFTAGLIGLDCDRITETFFSLYPHEELTQNTVEKIIQQGYNKREE